MNYIFKNDLSALLKEKTLYFYIIILNCLLILSVLSSNLDPFYYKALGIKIDSISNIMEIVIYLFNITFYLFVQLKIIAKEGSVEQYLLRADSKKWIIYKIFTTSVVTIIIRIISYIMVYMYSIIFSISLTNTILLIICDLICLLFIQNIFLMNYMLFLAKRKTSWLAACLFLLMFIKRLLIPYTILVSYPKMIILLISLIIIIILNIFIGKREYKFVFERSK